MADPCSLVRMSSMQNKISDSIGAILSLFRNYPKDSPQIQVSHDWFRLVVEYYEIESPGCIYHDGMGSNPISGW